MVLPISPSKLIVSVIAVVTALAGLVFGQDSPVVVSSARVTVSGTSTVLDWSATSTRVEVRNVKIAKGLPGGDFFWVGVIEPGVVESFEVAVPVASLSSDRDEFTADMHAALKAERHPDIVFTLSRLEKRQRGALAYGTLQVSGLAKEIVLPLTTTQRDGKLLVSGRVEVSMADFGITPPTALMGVLRTDPIVTIRFETVLVRPTT